jgi:hypothetical protein
VVPAGVGESADRREVGGMTNRVEWEEDEQGWSYKLITDTYTAYVHWVPDATYWSMQIAGPALVVSKSGFTILEDAKAACLEKLAQLQAEGKC